MKMKTSVTLSEDVLEQVDQLAGSQQSRSAFMERRAAAIPARKKQGCLACAGFGIAQSRR
jgi:predicted transcriptional regulator